jgi:hypothetical protein
MSPCPGIYFEKSWSKTLKIFIHIGDARTGTTTLQTLMAENRKTLLEMGVEYPSVGTFGSGKGVGHHLLSFSRLPEWPKFVLPAKVSAEKAWGDLDEYLENHSDEKNCLFLSSEAFSSFDESGISCIREHLKGHDVIPIFVYQEPADWARSMREHQIIRGHKLPPMSKKMKRDLGQEKCDRWSKFFDVRCVPYGPNCLGGVLSVAGIDISKLALVEKRNKQPADGTIELLNELNAIPMLEENRKKFNQVILNWATIETESTKNITRKKKRSGERRRSSKKTVLQIIRNRSKNKLQKFFKPNPFLRRLWH